MLFIVFRWHLFICWITLHQLKIFRSVEGSDRSVDLHCICGFTLESADLHWNLDMIPQISCISCSTEWIHYLSKHPEQDLVNYLVSRFTDGFRLGLNRCPNPRPPCRNSREAKHNTAIVQELVHKEVARGHMLGPFDEPPLPNMVFSPLNIIPKPSAEGFRLIQDLACLYNSQSINQCIPEENSLMQYHYIEEVVNYFESCWQRPGVLFSKWVVSCQVGRNCSFPKRVQAIHSLARVNCNSHSFWYLGTTAQWKNYHPVLWQCCNMLFHKPQKADIPAAMELIRHLTLSCLQCQIFFRVEHIPGKINKNCDLISRNKIE